MKGQPCTDCGVSPATAESPRCADCQRERHKDACRRYYADHRQEINDGRRVLQATAPLPRRKMPCRGCGAFVKAGKECAKCGDPNS